jgi:hypothetical protein
MMSSTTRSIALSPPSLSPGVRKPQAFRPDHEVDVAGRERRLLGDPHRTDPLKLHPSRTRGVDAPGQEVAVADEFSDEAVGRPVVDVERGSDLFDLAVAEHGDAIGHRHGLGLVVRDVDHRDADLAMDALDLDLHLLAQVLVERAQRLVEQKHIRIEHEAARERDPLLLAAG